MQRSAAQWTLEAGLCLPVGRVRSRLVDMGVRGLREVLVRAGDPSVRYEIGGRSLMLPLSHELPYYRRTHRGYGDNFGFLVSVIESAVSHLTVIDVGANVGDSVAVARGFGVDAAFLCIEGDARYVTMLNDNLPALGAVEVAHAVVGRASGVSHGSVETAAGTGRFVHNEVDATLLVTVDELLERVPRFQHSKLLKVDVDGADFDVLAGAERLLQRERPVLFVEYDPVLQRESGHDPLGGLDELDAVGYDRFIAYDNLGVMLTSGRLSDTQLVVDLTEYSMAKGHGYWDLAVFAAGDESLFETVIAAEAKQRAAKAGSR